jgi:hypothetical protein
LEEGSADVTYYAAAVDKCSSYTRLWENLLNEKETRLCRLPSNSDEQKNKLGLHEHQPKS